MNSTGCSCGLSRYQRILICGDGDLSFSYGLVQHLTSEAHREEEGEEEGTATESTSSDSSTVNSSPNFASFDLQIICTTYEPLVELSTRYAGAPANATALRQCGIQVLHGIDARRLPEYSNLMPWATARRLGLSVDENQRHGIRLTNESSVTHTEEKDSSSHSEPNHSPHSTHSAATISTSSVSPLSVPCTFHTIIFNFPHVGGKSRNHLNRALLTEFFQSATQLLVKPGDKKFPVISSGTNSIATPSAASSSLSSLSELESDYGRILLSLLPGQGGTPADPVQRPNYGDHWQLLECASKANLILTRIQPFVDSLYTGYANRGFRSRNEEFFWRGQPITHILVPSSDPLSIASTASVNGASSLANIKSINEKSVQAQISRDLCRLRHHPLEQICSFVTQFFSRCDDPQRLLLDDLKSVGLRRLPFEEGFESPIISHELLHQTERSSSARATPIEDSSSAPVTASVVAHVISDPCASILPVTTPSSSPSHPIFRPDLLAHLPRLLQLPHSGILAGPVIEASSHLDSFQWNLEPIVSVATNMAGQVTQPICVQLAAANPRSTTKNDSRMTSSTSSSDPPTKVATSATSDSVAVESVPFMRGGIPVLHHQLIVQLFGLDDTSASAPLSRVSTAIETDFHTAITSCLQTLFGETMPIRIQPTVAARTNLRVAINCNATIDIPLDHEIQLLANQIWHGVGRGGIFLSPAIADCASTSSTSTACGWLCELGLEKLTMLRFQIPDPRWFWSQDARFMKQFQPSHESTVRDISITDSSIVAESTARVWHPFQPISLYPLCYVRDISFWLKSHSTLTAGATATSASQTEGSTSFSDIHQAVIDLITSIGSDSGDGPSFIGSVSLTDQFLHPQRGHSLRYRCIFNSVDQALSPNHVLQLQERIRQRLVTVLGVEVR